MPDQLKRLQTLPTSPEAQESSNKSFQYHKVRFADFPYLRYTIAKRQPAICHLVQAANWRLAMCIITYILIARLCQPSQATSKSILPAKQNCNPTHAHPEGGPCCLPHSPELIARLWQSVLLATQPRPVFPGLLVKARSLNKAKVPETWIIKQAQINKK